LDPTERIITKNELLSKLIKIRKTAISKWTLSLKNSGNLLKERRLQLKTNLNKNSRLRAFIIDNKSIEEFNEKIVTFIKEYCKTYHFKITHDQTPLFCLDCTANDFNDICNRLYGLGVKYTDGYRGNRFEAEHFFESQ
jgi:hypothetical protein